MKYLLLILLLSLTACDKPKSDVLKDFNREGQVMHITVHTFKNQKALLKATKQYNTTNQIGLAVWNNKDTYCDIYVIKAVKVKSKHDVTWGHELRHCTYGTFHKEH